MKRIAKLAVAPAIVALMVGGFAPSANADVGDVAAGALVFTASATVDNPLWAPVSPACGVGLCPATPTQYHFDSNNGGQFGQFCAGVVVDTTSSGVVNVGLRAQDADVVPTCRIKSDGFVEPSPHVTDLVNLGPWCGLSSGYGTISILTVGSWTPPAGSTTEVVWLTSAGTVLPLVLTMSGADISNPGDPGHPEKQIVGGGAVQTTGAQPGTCGLVPPNFLPTTSFTVTGFSAFAAVDAD